MELELCIFATWQSAIWKFDLFIEYLPFKSSDTDKRWMRRTEKYFKTRIYPAIA